MNTAGVAERPGAGRDGVALVGGAMSIRIESYTTSDDPRHRLPMNSSSAPSSQRPPPTNTMQHAASAPAQANAAHQQLLARIRSAIAPTTGQEQRRHQRRHRDDVEGERAGGDAEPQYVEVGVARPVRRPDVPAGGGLGDRRQVRREQHRADGGDVAGVRPVVEAEPPVLALVDRGRGGEKSHARKCVRSGGRSGVPADNSSPQWCLRPRSRPSATKSGPLALGPFCASPARWC